MLKTNESHTTVKPVARAVPVRKFLNERGCGPPLPAAIYPSRMVVKGTDDTSNRSS